MAMQAFARVPSGAAARTHARHEARNCRPYGRDRGVAGVAGAGAGHDHCEVDRARGARGCAVEQRRSGARLRGGAALSGAARAACASEGQPAQGQAEGRNSPLRQRAGTARSGRGSGTPANSSSGARCVSLACSALRQGRCIQTAAHRAASRECRGRLRCRCAGQSGPAHVTIGSGWAQGAAPAQARPARRSAWAPGWARPPARAATNYTGGWAGCVQSAVAVNTQHHGLRPAAKDTQPQRLVPVTARCRNTLRAACWVVGRLRACRTGDRLPQQVRPTCTRMHAAGRMHACARAAQQSRRLQGRSGRAARRAHVRRDVRDGHGRDARRRDGQAVRAQAGRQLAVRRGCLQHIGDRVREARGSRDCDLPRPC